MAVLLLVDDEPIVRQGLRSLIDWEQLGFSVIHEAATAKNALAILEKHQVDLIISDIVMTETDGITLVEQAKQRHPDTRAILITSFEDFDNARRAVSSGAATLLTKRDLTPDMLERELHRLFSDRPDTFLDTSLFSNGMNQCLSGLLSGDALNRLDQESVPPPHGAVGVFRLFRPVSRDCLNVLAEQFPKSGIVLRSGHVWLLIALGVEEEERDQVDRQSETRIRRRSERVLRNCGAVEAVRWAPFHNRVEEPVEAVATLHRWLDEQFWEAQTGVAVLQPTNPTVSVGPCISFALKQELADAFLHGSDMHFGDLLDRVASDARQRGTSSARFRLAVTTVVGSAVLETRGAMVALTTRLADLARSQSYEAFHRQMLQIRLDWKVHHESETALDERIRKAMTYIEDQLPARVPIETAATVCNMSASTFSRLFRSEVGITFRDYLGLRRVQIAKSCLEYTPSMLVYQLSEKAGFEDVRQFNRVFSRWTGMTPSQYRRQLERDVS